ncbi:hypothetical protein [Sulfurovum mangrovi]|uniref:hypothetical protein n=1 Tax=Sulfurovum mangrovi TaxID=2893889 RepID=UPI001E2B9103|nr:hypothetical protein [Sulfurovum mangrovi]UFH59848.1 hypothetical protein LN246_03145 [Sulfurovum mangrovi]UFH59899.1 hypothetical protein LN246_03405 [Sulfurovum mangrovi]
MIQAIARVLKRIVDWHSSITAPMRKWRHGEDGKYVHIVLGVEALLLFVAIALLLGQREFSFIGLSLYMIFAAGFVEFVQRAFLGGRNTKMQALFDAFWMWFGGTAVSYFIYAAGLIKFSFYS